MDPRLQIPLFGVEVTFEPLKTKFLKSFFLNLKNLCPSFWTHVCSNELVYFQHDDIKIKIDIH